MRCRYAIPAVVLTMVCGFPLLSCEVVASPTSTPAIRQEKVLDVAEAVSGSDTVVVARLHEIKFPNPNSPDGYEMWIEVLESLKGDLEPGARIKIATGRLVSRDYKSLLFLDRVDGQLYAPSGDYRVFSSGPYGRIQTTSVADLKRGSALHGWFFLQTVSETRFNLTGASRAENVEHRATDGEDRARASGQLVPVRQPMGYMKLYTQVDEVIAAARAVAEEEVSE